MVAKNGTEITDFSNPNDTNQYDHDSVEDCFDFLKQRSQFNINGYGVVYYTTGGQWENSQIITIRRKK